MKTETIVEDVNKFEDIEKIEVKETQRESSVYHHEGGELFAEDVEQHMAVFPEVGLPSEEVKIEDIQVGDSGVPLTEARFRDRASA